MTKTKRRSEELRETNVQASPRRFSSQRARACPVGCVAVAGQTRVVRCRAHLRCARDSQAPMPYYGMADQLRQKQRSFDVDEVHPVGASSGFVGANVRFSTGDTVECDCGGWQLGTVAALLWEPPAPGVAPMFSRYQVRLDHTGSVVTIPDTASRIRLPTRRTPMPGNQDHMIVTRERHTAMIGNVDVLLGEMQDRLLQAKLLRPEPRDQPRDRPRSRSRRRTASAAQGPAGPAEPNEELSHRLIRCASTNTGIYPASGWHPTADSAREAARRHELQTNPQRAGLTSCLDTSLLDSTLSWLHSRRDTEWDET